MWTYKANTEQVNTFTAKKANPHPAGNAPVQPFVAQKKPATGKIPQTPQPTPKATENLSAAGWRDKTEFLYSVQPGQPAQTNVGQAYCPQARPRAGRQDRPPIPKKAAACGKKNIRLLGIAYLAGLPAGSLAFHFLGADAGVYMGYYLDARLQTITGPPLRVLSNQFLAAFLQLSLVLLCGFCAFGAALLVLQAAVRGAVFGCFCAGLFGRYSMQGALAEGLLFWLPEVLQALVQIMLGACALQMSLQLAEHCFSEKTRPSLRIGEFPRQLLGCYLVCCLAETVPCSLSALLGLLFGPVLSGIVPI